MSLLSNLMAASLCSVLGLGLTACAEDKMPMNNTKSVVSTSATTTQTEALVDLIAAEKEGKWGYADKTGNLVIAYQYDDASDFSNGLGVVVDGDWYGAIDATGETIVPFKYDYLGDFSDGLSLFSKNRNGLLGFIDIKGNEAIPAIWNMGLGFSEGMAAVGIKDNGDYKWGFIDTTGSLVIKPQYDAVYIENGEESSEARGGYFKDGQVKVYNMSDKLYTITIDTEGNELDHQSTVSDYKSE